VDTAENVAKLSKILALMDTDLFKDIHWRFYTLEHTDVDDLSKDLDKIFKTKGLYIRPGIDPGGLQIMPLKTINSLLVVTKWEEVLDVVGDWVYALDKGQSEKGARVYVYFVKNGLAKDIADLLKQVYGGKKSSKPSSTKKTVLVKREKKVEQAETIVSGELSGEVEIIADEVNNAILIKARPKDYAIMAGVLKQIDVVPRQVLIDVMVVEVSLDDAIEYGVEWFFKTHLGNYPGNVALTDKDLKNLAKDKDLGDGIGGFAYSLYSSGGDLRALINLLATETDVNILSAPNILAVDNKESSIEVVHDEPTVTSASSSEDGGRDTTTIQYREVGIKLHVTPCINESGLVRMEITQEVSSLLKEREVGGVETPSFQSRKATTNLVVENKHTIVIGGLMQTHQEKSHSGIPFLKDIPILGYLFGSKGYTTRKTELLFVITPHVIKTQEEADALTVEFAKKVESLRKVLEQKGVLQEKGILKQEGAIQEGDVVKTED
jgi:general secretion pathway protein D